MTNDTAMGRERVRAFLAEEFPGAIVDCGNVGINLLEFFDRSIAPALSRPAPAEDQVERVARALWPYLRPEATIPDSMNAARAALSAALPGEGWRSVDDALPPLDQIVIVRFASGYDGADLFAWGARLDECDGWLWGLKSGHGGDIRPDETAGWNDIEADDDYQVTHWMPLPPSPGSAPSPPARETAPSDSELMAAIKEALSLMDSGPDNPNAWNTVLADLPAGGVRCEERAERVVDILRTALSNRPATGASHE